MRIEFNAGQLNGLSIAMFGANAACFEQSVDSMKNGFESIRNSIYNMNGGVGILQEAVDLIGKRIDHDDQQRENVHTARQKCSEFLREVKATDRQVSEIVRQETKEFCKQYPHLAPQPSERDKGFLEHALDYLFKKGESFWKKGTEIIKNVIDWGIGKGKEVLDHIIDTATTAVAWLVEQGKNIYDGIKMVFTTIEDIITEFIDASIELIIGIIDATLEGLAELGEFVINLSREVLQTMIEITSSIVDFVIEHFDDILDIVFGIAEMIGGIATIIAAIGEEGFSLGSLTPLAALQLIGGGAAVVKGWDRMWGGICGATNSEPDGALKVFLRPTTSFEKMLNDIAPELHLGDTAKFMGDMLSLAGGSVNGVTKVTEVIGIALGSISASFEYISSITDNTTDDTVSKVTSTISSGFDLKDLPSNWKSITDFFSKVFKTVK